MLNCMHAFFLLFIAYMLACVLAAQANEHGRSYNKARQDGKGKRLKIMEVYLSYNW